MVAFLHSVGSLDTGPTIKGDGVFLRTPTMNDFREWSELRAESRSFLAPWEPIWPSDDLTRQAFRRRLKRYQREIRDDLGYPFFLFRSGDNTLLGGLTLTHVRRGVAQACTLGYWMGAPHADRGHMTNGVRAVLPFVFETLKLHRIEAACLSHNIASIKLLEKTGFVREGHARNYLCINGRWQDHLLFARVLEDHLGLTGDGAAGAS
ncbi:ribosomal-protein-alanine N-acetyltransferase [Rhodobium orientis]|uniref:30S ribosomal protein S5 alanine N-acetyltransferase n=1 Tax=Rhodobium orientis TaxID=34017 RepID=A0A327JRM2_9HYPH|nr:GNAT family protein [Rhodobium orientis]MBB4304230.1 ribosomal-protein-alanine N-acetyltransferase [Rhodobium orientis]MBK5950699.1 30S ribosomal protein S5 alanine N-acetyltransferase [Rhodobium orientis]RAI28074.1 30S ribosomal protein S5 alanine N-acetyltransferase [Rhodobium orientis]